ncbi:hypothetical protein [Deinococcus koreensis]|uniref:hypothetical protein n=1 Tax=Deinococcus koreensis TaxID=2054903 RepID=UPI001FAFA72A|nr:hypothetical protein [Deinococcus koreensis]
MLDNILNTVKRGAEKVQRRGEEVAQAARLRVEVFQLGRELDGHFARLGRSYHSGAQIDVLQGVQEDIRRVEEEIRARERLIQELGDPADLVTDEPASPPEVQRLAPGPRPASAASTPTVPAAVPHPGQEVSMTHSDKPAVPTSPNPTVQHSDELETPKGDTASMGNEPGRDPVRRDHTLGQAEVMKGHNDPLDK